MENKNELAKEERTIFIVLAIIVLIAIGVLVTWYFTKDKKEEAKDKDTNDKTVETTKKDTSDLDVGDTYNFTPSQTVVISDNVVEEDVSIVEVAAAEPVVNTPKITDYNQEVKFYYPEEMMNVSNAEVTSPNNDLIKLENGIIISVKAYDPMTNVEVDALGKYVITDGTNITFNEEGKYVVTVRNNDGQEYEIEILVISEENFKTLVDSFIISTELDLKDQKYYDTDKYNNFLNNFQNFKIMGDEDLIAKRNAYLALEQEYKELSETFKAIEYAQDVTEEINNRDSQVSQEQTDKENINALLNEALGNVNEQANAYAQVSMDGEGSVVVNVTDSTKPANTYTEIIVSLLTKLQENKENITAISLQGSTDAIIDLNQDLNSQVTSFVQRALPKMSEEATLGDLGSGRFTISVNTVSGSSIPIQFILKVPEAI